MGEQRKLTPTKEERQQFAKDVAYLKKFKGQGSDGKRVGRVNMNSVRGAINRIKRYEARYGS